MINESNNIPISEGVKGVDEIVNQKTLYIIAGCNGAGKTTASYTILPQILDCHEFVNADEIARGISPFNPSSVSTIAGKIMLKRIDELLESNMTFAIETTLASKLFTKTVLKARDKGYITVLLFFWIESIEIAKSRVAQRVKAGGHHIPDDVIERRYRSGIRNLFDLYYPIVDIINIYDNTHELELIAQKHKHIDIINQKKYIDLGLIYGKM